MNWPWKRKRVVETKPSEPFIPDKTAERSVPTSHQDFAQRHFCRVRQRSTGHHRAGCERWQPGDCRIRAEACQLESEFPRVFGRVDVAEPLSLKSCTQLANICLPQLSLSR